MTGVQACALPISVPATRIRNVRVEPLGVSMLADVHGMGRSIELREVERPGKGQKIEKQTLSNRFPGGFISFTIPILLHSGCKSIPNVVLRTEQRRGGVGCRAGGAEEHEPTGTQRRKNDRKAGTNGNEFEWCGEQMASGRVGRVRNVS